MQVYRLMDIVTSKANLVQRKQIKHHLLNIVDPDKEYNVAKYRKDALKICDKLFAKGKSPLFVGGTGLYYSIMVDGLFAKVPENKIIRNKLNTQLKQKGGTYLYKKLAKLDPAAANKIHPNDSRRIIRALEVYAITGERISELQKRRIGLGPEYEVEVFGLNMNRVDLYQKINQRVDKMFKVGLVKEVKRLSKFRLSKTAKAAIGIRELRDYFKGKKSLDESKMLIKRNSRRYAKRQLTWFRKDQRIKWININNQETTAQISLKLWKKLC